MNVGHASLLIVFVIVGTLGGGLGGWAVAFLTGSDSATQASISGLGSVVGFLGGLAYTGYELYQRRR